MAIWGELAGVATYFEGLSFPLLVGAGLSALITLLAFFGRFLWSSTFDLVRQSTGSDGARVRFVDSHKASLIGGFLQGFLWFAAGALAAAHASQIRSALGTVLAL